MVWCLNMFHGIVVKPVIKVFAACSQTIFSRRAGVSHRIHGVIIAAIELALAVIPYSLVQYLVRVPPACYALHRDFAMPSMGQ